MTRDMHLDTKPEWEIKKKHTGQAPLDAGDYGPKIHKSLLKNI